MATPDPDPRIGQVIDGRYRILERLAEGGMGVVYKAERVLVGKTVAVKFLHRSYADDKPSLARFERETRVLSKLTHPNCVSVIDFGVDGSPYLVMDFAGGTTLRAALDHGKLPLGDFFSIIRQVLAGLAHAHAQGIIHRDIKPANIMISDEIGTGRHVRILDFGLARLASSSNLTHSSVAIGTPSYMAPEQTVGGEVDVRTDLYQVGVVMFEMVTGERLFVADDTSTLLEMHRSARVPRIAEVAPNVETKPGLDDVLQKALAKDPKDRWQSAMELSSALEDVAAGRWRKPRSRARGLVAVLALLVIAGGAAAGVRIWKSKAAEQVASAGGGAAVSSGGAGPAAGEPGDRGVVSGSRTLDAGAGAAPPDAAAGDAASADAVVDAGAVAVAVDAGAMIPLGDAVMPDAAAAGTAGTSGPADAALAPSDAAGSGDATDPDAADEAVAPADPAAAERSQDSADERPAPPPPPPAPLAKTLPAVNALIKKGQRELAISSVHAMWQKAPKDARLPYLLGNLYFDKRWWTVGMTYYNAAIARLPAYKGNATLIRNVISALGSAKTRGKAKYLLTKVIGSGSKGLVRAAAKSHADPAVRREATALLKRW